MLASLTLYYLVENIITSFWIKQDFLSSPTITVEQTDYNYKCDKCSEGNGEGRVGVFWLPYVWVEVILVSCSPPAPRILHQCTRQHVLAQKMLGWGWAVALLPEARPTTSACETTTPCASRNISLFISGLQFVCRKQKEKNYFQMAVTLDTIGLRDVIVHK